MSSGLVRISADRAGVELPVGTAGRCQAIFDDVPIWSFEPDQMLVAEVRGEGEGAHLFVPWPAGMQQWLTGRAHLRVTTPQGELDAGEVAFDGSPERVRFVDEYGVRVVIDKWGLPQRPFSLRGRETTEAMADTALEIIEVLREECGVELWMAFGTLLGAARSGRAIGHDADMDLAYLSEETTPAAMEQEVYAMRRALTRRGFRVVNKSGSFLTVTFTAPDGAPASIDLYTTFYLSGLLHETATVRAPVPRDDVLPLGELEFEGRMLPAPANPDRILRVSYGPSWRTPDPDFIHRPTRDVIERFDGWFGTAMRERRQWEAYWAGLWRPEDDEGPGFREWVDSHLPRKMGIVDLGAGRGDDAIHFARQRRRVAAIDYARGAFAAHAEAPDQTAPRVTKHTCNLYDIRDTLSMAGILARRMPPNRAILARHLFDAVDAGGRANAWRFASLVLSVGGRMFIEVDERAADGTLPRFAGSAGRRFPLQLDELEAAWRRAGAVEDSREQIPAPADVPEGTTRWRIVLTWPARRPSSGRA